MHAYARASIYAAVEGAFAYL